jgi:hypothetical protein
MVLTDAYFLDHLSGSLVGGQTNDYLLVAELTKQSAYRGSTYREWTVLPGIYVPHVSDYKKAIFPSASPPCQLPVAVNFRLLSAIEVHPLHPDVGDDIR